MEAQSAIGNPGPTGAGAVVYQNGLTSIPTMLASAVSSQSNNVHGEIFAIKLACSNISKAIKKGKHRSINIFCDCQSAILVVANLEKAENYSSLIREIQLILFELQYNYNVDIHFFWVPGHAEIPQNEEADRLAKVGAKHAIRCEMYHPITFAEASRSIKRITALKWIKRWNLQGNSSNYKTKVCNPTSSVIHDLVNIAPSIQKQIIRMRLDHTNLPAHRSRYIENSDPLGSNCQVICDVQHMLTDCSAYQHYRQLLLDKLQFITSSSYQKLTVQCISSNTILGFDSRINPTLRKMIFDSLSTFLRNSRANP